MRSRSSRPFSSIAARLQPTSSSLHIYHHGVLRWRTGEVWEPESRAKVGLYRKHYLDWVGVYCTDAYCRNLDDFKSSSCWTPFAYGYLLLMLVVSISVYAVDTFTAINLLAFDKWAGQIKPEIPLNISRWIFAGCIILSFVLLVYRWIRAVRVMRQGGVAKSYLDPLAVRVQSIRWGKARGWRRFLVFAELTKSRKGADYVALFAHFSFEAWLRIIFAEGPRQVINAITLYSVLRLKTGPRGRTCSIRRPFSSGTIFRQYWNLGRFQPSAGCHSLWHAVDPSHLGHFSPQSAHLSRPVPRLSLASHSH